ncbi:putative Angio-associated migratory cell protein [Basidiobolus meristosporus CBS 931.73]|uniref:Ribosome assembly protein 4 n=1 Tax=Basidiobolus meristosporus CBS 931.73 TaxID=1314790 RepID=A0A1Y1YF77_9FUNG|nr:putative Angio-associated migratory cell protein [Basidiobolus meristosporus CBS 931.73]|eukprot:ORX96563.1 putative Angio-associated migratory cell protein [Basidiobolus meristosporus CBS 931.73]
MSNTKAKQEEVPQEPVGHVIAQFKSAEGDSTGPPLNIPADVTPEQLSEETMPYSFMVDGADIITSLHKDIIVGQKRSTEDSITITYHPQAVFRVRAVTRCSSTLSGHSEAILSCSFSPDGSQLATGSGDTTVRIWDLNTETPHHTLAGHKNWVLYISWSPDGKFLASGSMDNMVRLWDPKTGKPVGDALRGHTKWITCIAWEPLHLNPKCTRFATSSKDGTVRIWDTRFRRAVITLSQHTAAVTCVKWGGDGLIYTSSQDKTIKVWDSEGKLVKTLEGHGHWVNTMALSTDSVLRTGSFDHTGKRYTNEEEAKEVAFKRWEEAKGKRPERLVSGSDDFTMYLWEPATSKKPIARLTGHQKLVNQVCFSPDGRIIASASFDNSVKLWDGFTGKFIASLRGHVGPVYQVVFSSDSRMVMSGSKDSTLKIWDMKTKKLKLDLPGHQDEVYTVDWSPGGDRAASGGKDRTLKM